MQARLSTILVMALAVFVAAAAGDAASAKPKKHRAAPTHRVSQEPASGIPYDEYGNPIIMQGFHVSRGAVTDQPALPREPRQVRIPRGSSTYIPPPVPSPYGANSPPAPGALAPGPGVYHPPPINSFSDRVTNCIMSAPFNAGVGNNPAGRQAYVGQCAN